MGRALANLMHDGAIVRVSHRLGRFCCIMQRLVLFNSHKFVGSGRLQANSGVLLVGAFEV
jgi:hypothetical protein